VIPFEEQLAAIVAAVAFVSPARARVTSLRGAQREVAVASERDTFGGLAAALYVDRYSLLPTDAAQPGVTATAFLGALQAANPIAQRYQDGWTVMRADAGGAWLVNAAQQQRFALLGEIVPLANAIAPGLPVRLVPMREMVTAPAGHYVISGRHGFDPQTGRQVRFYWNVAPDGAAPFLRDIATRLERRRIPFQAKVPVDPAGYARTDAGVLYLNDEEVEASRDAIAAAYHMVRGNLRPSVPLFTRELAPGLAFAESPPTRDSFGMHRCSLVAEGLLRAEQRGAKDPQARLALLRERLTAYGLALDRLERNPTSRYPHRLDAFVQELAA
jgi:type III HopA1-like effector protein